MKSLKCRVLAIIAVAVLSVGQPAEAGPILKFLQNRQPIRRAVHWKREHTPIRNLFANQQPVRKALRAAGPACRVRCYQTASAIPEAETQPAAAEDESPFGSNCEGGICQPK